MTPDPPSVPATAPAAPARGGRLPLRWVLVVSFLLQLFAVVALVGWLAIRSGRQAVEQVTAELRRELNFRIWEYLDRYLEAPHRLNALNAQAIVLGELDLHDPEALGRHFRRQLDALPSASFIFVGTPHGGAAGAGRNRDGVVVVDTTDLDPVLGLVAGTRRELVAAADGSPGEQLKATPGFDARERPWYRAALAAEGPAWSEVYTFFAEPSLAVAASQPVVDQGGELVAVLGVDLTLAKVGAFLQQLRIGETGETFIVEPGGALIATSTTEPPVRSPPAGGAPERLQARASREPLIAGAARALEARYGSLSAIHEAANLSFEIAGERHFLDVCPLGDPHGLDWLIVIVIPERDFLGPIEANTRATLALCLGALALAIGLGLLTARWITRPIEQLGRAARALAAGRLDQRVEAGGTRELRALAAGFNRMAEQLHSAFGELEARVAERTAELSEAKDAADRANLAKSRFLANMSHEIRSPLAAVLGYVELLGDRAKTAEEAERYLNTIRQQGEHLDQLLSDLLDLSRIEAGRLELEPGPCRLEEVLAQLVSAFEPRASERALALRVDTDARLPWSFECDAGRLRQVLSNLLSNAIKYTEQGSVTLRVSSELAVVSVDGGGPSEALVRFEVQDTGVGIELDAQKRLFRTFTQVDSSSERRSGGFGLGLSIVQQLVELMGGTVAVVSEVGVGSTFTVRLPLVACADWARSERLYDGGEEAEVSSELAPLAGRVLVADDSKALQLLCKKMLERWGLECLTADDGQAAVALGRRERCDVILMDWQMPKLDGLEATERLRRHGVTVPIIALTAAAMAGDREKCIAAGCSAYLAKPIDFKALHRMLGQMLAPAAAPVPVSEADPELAALQRRYLDSLPGRLEELRAALARRDWKAMQAGAHRLAGTAGTYGLNEVYTEAAALEELGAGEDVDAAERGLGRLERAVERARVG